MVMMINPTLIYTFYKIKKKYREKLRWRWVLFVGLGTKRILFAGKTTEESRNIQKDKKKLKFQESRNHREPNQGPSHYNFAFLLKNEIKTETIWKMEFMRRFFTFKPVRAPFGSVPSGFTL